MRYQLIPQDAANRGKPWRALFYLQRVRNRALSLASERHGRDADEFAHVDELPARERDPLMASLVCDLDRGGLLDAINAATDAFLAELARGDLELARRLAAPAAAVRAGFSGTRSGDPSDKEWCFTLPRNLVQSGLPLSCEPEAAAYPSMSASTDSTASTTTSGRCEGTWCPLPSATTCRP
jgi:hypothetical protein